MRPRSLRRPLPGVPALLLVLPLFLVAVLPAMPAAAASGSGPVDSAAPGAAAGHLLIIGGGPRPASLVAEVVRLAGGAEARIAVIPNASSVPEEVGPEQAAELEAAGAGEAFPLVFDRAGADDPEVLARLEGVTGIFFSGGDQRRLAADLLGTALLDRLHRIHRRGGVVAGTSAGAAVMGPVMITGDEVDREGGVLDPDAEGAEEPFTAVRAGRTVTTPGLGFLPGVLVDQHFLARKRHNRLLARTLEEPALLGVGIDESTAIRVDPDRSFTVLGEAQVLVLDASGAQVGALDKGAGQDLLTATGVTLHLLGPGQRYDLDARRPLPAPTPPAADPP